MEICAYCGMTTEGNKDVYGQDACNFCLSFFDAHPVPPVPPPAGSVLVLLENKQEDASGSHP